MMPFEMCTCQATLRQPRAAAGGRTAENPCLKYRALYLWWQKIYCRRNVSSAFRISIQPHSTRGYGHLSGPGSRRLGTGLSRPGQRWQGSKGDSRDISTFVTSCPIGMSLPADSSCEGRVSLHFTRTGFSIPTPAGVVAEKGSEYILAHTGPRELDRHPLGGCGLGFWFSSRLYYTFGKSPSQH